MPTVRVRTDTGNVLVKSGRPLTGGELESVVIGKQAMPGVSVTPEALAETAPKAVEPEAPARTTPAPRGAKIPFTDIRLPDISPLRAAGAVQDVLAWPAKQAFRAAGKLEQAYPPKSVMPSWLLPPDAKTPEQAERRAETYGNVTRDVAESAAMPWSKIPGIAGMAYRALQAGLLGGTQRAAATQDMTEGAKAALVSAALQPAAEVVLGPVIRAVTASGRAKSATSDYAAAKAARDFKIKHDEAMTEWLNKIEKNVFTKAAAEHADDAAAKIAADLKRNVPPLAELPANTKGLVDMVYGQGKQKVSEFFDDAMRQVAERAAGQTVQVPTEAAKRLGLPIPEDPLAGLTAAARDALARSGRLPEGVGTGLVTVDAAELAKRATGFWKKDPGAYRAAVNALDEANIGDPLARAAYKYYQGLVQIIDKTKALTGETLHPEKLLAGGTQLRTVEELRRRGIGDVFRGPTQAARGGPVAPTPREVPALPPELARPDIRTAHLPWYAKHLIGGGIGNVLAGWPGAAIGAGLAHAVLPSRIVTSAPLTPGVEQALRTMPGPLATGAGQLAREALEARSRSLLRQAEQFNRARQQYQR